MDEAARPGGRSLESCDLCRGPGNLTRALGITLAENLADLVASRLVDRGSRPCRWPVSWGPRIGIRVGVERPWRCWIAGHPAVSRSGSSRRIVRIVRIVPTS